MDYGKRLREMRMKAGFKTQQALADRAGLTQPFIHQLETEKRHLTNIDTARQLAEAMNLPLSDLLTLMPADSQAHEAVRNELPLCGVVSAGGGAGEQFPPGATLSVSGLYPVGTVAYLVKGTSMVDHHVCDGDYILVRPQPTAELGEVVVVYVPDVGTVVKIKRKKHYASANDRQPRDPIPTGDGCREFGVLVGVIRKC